MENYFEINGVQIISRIDYESIPIPMYATEFTDDQMQNLAETIYLTLCNYGGFNKTDVDDYFQTNEMDKELFEDIDNAFWKEMEIIAVNMGMRYYEDMSDEEYNKICNK